MANGNIRGITIEIGGDTKGLDNALKDVNKQSKDLQTELKAVERGLKFDPGNVELVRQKQELLTASITATSEKLDVLKTAQSQVEAQFQRGDIGVEQYRAFQRELQSTENEMKRLRSQYDSLNIDQERLAQVTSELGTFFNATNTDVEQFAGTLGTRLTQAIRDGSASADQMERALRLMGQQALGASTDIDRMRETLRSVDNGSSLDEIRVDFRHVSESANEAEKSVKGFGNELSTVVGGLAAGGGIAGVVSSALDASSLSTKIDISFNVPEESKQSIIEAVRTIEAYGIEGEEALEGIRRQWALNKEASDETNSAFVEGAAVIAKAYAGIDFIELVQETNEFAAALQISNGEALALTDALLKTGFPPEQLDILSEYGLQMKAIGFSTAEIQAIFEKGIETKSWNIDNLNDGVKEARLQMATFGLEIPKALKSLITDTGISLTQFQNWGKAVAGGGKEGAIAMAEVSDWLQTIEDDALRNEMAIKVFGTKAEDQGDNMIAVFQGLADAQDKTTQNLDQYNASVERMKTDPLVRMKDALADVMTSLQPLLLMVADFVAKIAEWVSNNVGLAAALLAIGTALGVLTGGFAVLMPAIGALVGLWPVLVAAISGIGAPILIAVGAIAGLGLAFTALWKESETFRDTLTAVFNSIKDVVTSVLDVVVNFVKEKVSQIKDFWTSEGLQILAAVENAFNGIKGIIETIMPAVQFVIEYVWTAIQNVINGALDVIMGAIKVFSGLFTGDFDKMWEGVKQIFSGAIDLIIGLMSLSFVGSIRTLITNLAKSGVSLLKGMWDDIVNAFTTMGSKASGAVSSMVSSVVGFFNNILSNAKSIFGTMKTFGASTFEALKTAVINSASKLLSGVKTSFTNMLNAVKTTMGNLKTNVSNLWNEVIAIFKPDALLQVGKDIVNGLIKGIGDMFGGVKEKVEALAALIPEWAKKILGIASPSKVFKQIGLWTGEGLAIGLDNSSKTVNKAMENIGDGIFAVSNKFQKEYDDLISEFNKKNENKEDAALKKIQNIRNSAAKKKKALTKAQLQEIAVLEASHLDQKETNDIAFNKKYKAMVEKSEKEYLDVIKNYIADKKSLEELSLVDEAKIWEQSIELFTEGTKQRIELQKAYKSSVEAVNKELMEINDKYTSKIQKIDDDFIKQSADKTKEYVDEFKKREQSLVSFAGTFDEFAVSADVTGAQLLANLKGQVKGFEDWKKEIEKLSSKAIDDGLLAELQDMGPKALAELRALNSLSEDKLTEYSNLYAEKAKQAREQTEKELAPLKDSTEQQISELRKAANSELAKLEKDWIKEIKDITGGTANELKTLESIGEDAVRGLISGMNSMHPSLKSTADAIAETVSKTVKDTLKVKSPSRVMIAVGKDVGEGLAIGIEGSQGRVANASRLLANAIVSESTEVLADANKTFAEKLEYWFTPGENADEYVNKMSDIESQLTTIEKNGIRSRENIHQDAADRRAEIDQKYLSTFENIEQYKQQLVKGMLAVGKDVDINADWIVEAANGLYAGPLELYKEELERVKQFEDKALEEYENLTDEKAKLQKELANTRLSAEKNFIDKFKSLNELSVADEVKLYETLMQSYAEGSEQRLHYEQRSNDTRKQALQEAVKDVDEFGDALIDALDKRYKLQLDLELANSDSYYDSIINPLKEAEKMLEKQFADEDRADNMAGLQSALSNARTEADRKRIQQQIDEENKKWNRQQQKDAILIEIEKAEAAKKEARDGITGKYEAMMSQEALEHEARMSIVEGNEREMIDLLNSFNPKWQDAGQSFGDKLINGLNSMKLPIQQAVQDIGALIQDAFNINGGGFDLSASGLGAMSSTQSFNLAIPEIKISSQPIVLTANIDLDGERVAAQTFNYTNDLLGSSTSNNIRWSGVKK